MTETAEAERQLLIVEERVHYLPHIADKRICIGLLLLVHTGLLAIMAAGDDQEEE